MTARTDADGVPYAREDVTTPPEVFLTDEALDAYVDPHWDGKS